MVKREKQLTHLWELYEGGIDYQNRLGLREQIAQSIRFYEGNQWPSPTENTKNLPRPVVNIVKQICRSKKSAILSTPARVFYKSYSQGTNVERFNSFASSVFKEMGQDSLDRLAIEDGIKKGSYFYHYFWDKDKISLTGKREGGVSCELIDPLNIFFANPCELNEQRQRWILIASQKELSSIISMSRGKISPEALELDKEEGGQITLLTRYFRTNGEVFFEVGTKSHIIIPKTSLCPRKDGCDKIMAGLYPVVAGCYERREGSIYGISEIEGIIPNQKAINFNIAMSLLNAQECAWGKYIALPGALKNQKISNVPGQVLIDHTGTGTGIRKMEESPLSEVPVNISDRLIEITRSVTGSSQLLSGEGLWSNMSGSAIAQLQAQADLPINELRQSFYDAKRRQGLVLAQFLKLYYFMREYITTEEREDGAHEIFDVFTSSDYENSLFDVVVEVTSGQRSTIASDISLLDSCLKRGSISLETYIRAYPDSAISNKTELLKHIELEKSSEISKLKEEIERLKARA